MIMAIFNHHRFFAWVFILPQLLITLVFFIWPACSALFQSLLYSDAFGLQQHFAGLANFTDLFLDSSYVKAIWVTLVIAVSVTILTMFFGLIMASLVSQMRKSQGIYKSIADMALCHCPCGGSHSLAFFMSSYSWLDDSFFRIPGHSFRLREPCQSGTFGHYFDRQLATIQL